jgi:mitogen-activated protein kinase kinase
MIVSSSSMIKARATSGRSIERHHHCDQMPTPPRPIGPRSNPRSLSPAPHAFPQPVPQHSRRPSNSSLLSVSPSNYPPPHLATPSPPRSLKLQIPGIVSKRPTTPKGLPVLTIPQSNGHNPAVSPTFDSAFEAGGYYGGPLAVPAELSSDSPGEVTMRPPSRITPKLPDTIEDIEKTLKALRIGKKPSVPPPIDNTTTSATSPEQEEESRLSSTDYPTDFSDSVLEELARLGEGAGGAVHQVLDKRTNLIMARKTITTREAPMKQLLRELDIIQSTAHPNIVLFYGAYMSPSSSEVKILMEFCPGKSLEAIGKRVADRTGRVGEKVAGRLAEGVSPPFLFIFYVYN